ncbi:MAG: hypothetical protein Q9174_006821 [Haloplaca sp. 1 TL-2023]
MFSSLLLLLPLLATPCLSATTTHRVGTTKKPQGDGPTGSNPPCNSYESCERPGLLNWNILQTTLMDPNAKDRTDGLQIFNTWYAVQLGRMPYFLSPMLQRDLTNHGFDVKLLHSWETTARYKANGAPDPFAAAYCKSNPAPAVYSTAFSKAQRGVGVHASRTRMAHSLAHSLTTARKNLKLINATHPSQSTASTPTPASSSATPTTAPSTPKNASPSPNSSTKPGTPSASSNAGAPSATSAPSSAKASLSHKP